jgi:phosphatidylglycerol lysyltransferase
MASWWRRLSPLLGVALLCAAIYAVADQLQQYTAAGLWHAVRAVPPPAFGLAVALTALNYAILSGYDLLAFVYLRRRLAWWRVSLASFVGYAVSNSLGFAGLTGATARYRFYSRWGLSNDEIGRIVAFYNATFGLGLLLLGGWSLLVAPPEALVTLKWHEWAAPLGAIFLALPAGYLMASALRRKPIRIFRTEITLPSPALVGAQFALSTVDWALAALILWILIPAPRPPFLETMSAFLTAQFVGLIFQVPGALGVLEGGILLLLGSTVEAHRVAQPQLIVALVAYRAIYYLLPLVAGLTVLVADEWAERRHLFRRWGRSFGALTISLAPPLIGGFAFVAGAILLFSGATPAAAARLDFLLHTIPLPVVALSHFIGSLIGLGLLLLSQALIRRLAAAWTLAVGSILVGIVAEILKGLDYEEATVLMLLLILLIRARREFDRRSNLFEHTFSIGWFTSVSFVVLSSVLLGLSAFRQPQNREVWWFYQSTAGVAIVLIIFFARFLRAAAPRLQAPSAVDLTDADRVIQQQRSSTPYLVYLGDKALLWNDTRTAFLMYAIHGRTWVALGDPVGPPREAGGLVRRFLEVVEDADGIPVFYQVQKDFLHRYADFGLAFAKAGEEALVPLATFSLDGGSRKKMRLVWHKLAKDGATFRLVAAADVPAILPELREVSDEWLAMKGAAEKGFSLGFFDESYLKRFPVAVLDVGGRPEAFANVWPGPKKAELSIDLMRHRRTAPKNSMEGLFIFLMLWGKAEGYDAFNLGMAPFSGLESSEFTSLWTRILSYVYRYGRTFYNFQGLRAYKDKFDPAWEPKYFAYPGGLSLPGVLYSVTALIASGFRTVVKARAPRRAAARAIVRAGR